MVSRSAVMAVERDHRVVRGALELLEGLTRRFAAGEAVTSQRLREVIDSIAEFERALRQPREATLRTIPTVSSRAQQRLAHEQLICNALLDDLRLRVQDLERSRGTRDRVVRAAIDFLTQQRECLDSVEAVLRRSDDASMAA